jgi:hypothetical protein
MQRRRLSRYLARFLGVAAKIPYYTLCETKSHFDSAHSCRKVSQILVKNWTLGRCYPPTLDLMLRSLNDLRGHPASEGSFKNWVGVITTHITISGRLTVEFPSGLCGQTHSSNSVPNYPRCEGLGSMSSHSGAEPKRSVSRSILKLAKTKR